MSIFDCALVVYRSSYIGFDFGQIASIQDVANTRSETFMFLVWNLFLAWIPYWLSMAMHHFSKKWIVVILLMTWLVFLPNAPYLVTDLLHVRFRPPVPYWYDTMMLFSFAWTGLFLGFLSLLDVQCFLEKKFGKKISDVLIWIAIILCAFGVYIGRCQRWNTWDIITHPYQLFCDIMQVVFHPIANLSSLGLAVVMTGVLGLGYMAMKVLVSD